jgi:hypothetical protein
VWRVQIGSHQDSSSVGQGAETWLAQVALIDSDTNTVEEKSGLGGIVSLALIWNSSPIPSWVHVLCL